MAGLEGGNLFLKEQRGVNSSAFATKPGEGGVKGPDAAKDNIFTASSGLNVATGNQSANEVGDALSGGNTNGAQSATTVSAKDAKVPSNEDVYNDAFGLRLNNNQSFSEYHNNNTAAIQKLYSNKNSSTDDTLQSFRDQVNTKLAKVDTSGYKPSSSGKTGTSGSTGASGGGNAIGVLQTVGGGLNSLGSLNNAFSSENSTSPEMKELNELNSQLQKELATLKTIEGDVTKLNTELGQMKEAVAKATESRDTAKQAVGQAQNDLDTHMSNKPTPQKDENGNITNQQEIDAWEQKKTELENTLKQKQKELESAEQKLTEATKNQENKQKEYDTKSKEKETQSAKCQQLQTKRDAALAKVKQANSLNGGKKAEGADKSGSNAEIPKADANGNIKAENIKDENLKSKLEAKYPGPRVAYTETEVKSVANQSSGSSSPFSSIGFNANNYTGSNTFASVLKNSSNDKKPLNAEEEG